MKRSRAGVGIVIGSLVYLLGGGFAPVAQVAGASLSDEEVADMAGGPAFARGSRVRDPFAVQIKEALAREPVASNGVRATYHNAAYGPHVRNRFDLWKATSDKPAPLVVFIHGGGFMRGDKSLLYNSGVLVDLLDAGMSVAGINYRYWHQDPRGFLASLEDIARAVQFLRMNAVEYGIDKERIGCYGGSAGGAASLWLAFHDDMADPESEDPVLRESTRIACAGAMATPSTLDLMQWPEILGMASMTDVQLKDTALRFGLADVEEIFSPKGEAVRARLDMTGLMSAGDPPVYVFNNEAGGVPKGVGHMGHHPNHAKRIKERANKLGIEAIVSAPEIGLVDPMGETLAGFFIRQLVQVGDKRPEG